MGAIAIVALRFLAGFLLMAGVLQAASADTEISCKYLLASMATALIGTNSFWAIWTRAILKEKDQAVNDRIADLRHAALKIKTD